MRVTVLDHPLAAHFLTRLRDRNTASATFRVITHRLTTLLALEATRNLVVEPFAVDTPLEPAVGATVAESIVVVPVLRAGLGMLEAFVELIPEVSIGYVGLERDHETAVASAYYSKFPPNLGGRSVFVLDPMLATGGSAANAIDKLKEAGAERVAMVCVIASPEGVTLLNERHPDVRIITAGLDRQLNDKKYILPGLGDFGDRLYGT
jgi:uracil phosphoribosyltransferase